jgi:hypothetical protein
LGPQARVGTASLIERGIAIKRQISMNLLIGSGDALKDSVC